MSNEWKDVVGYEGVYQVSNAGVVRRILQKSGAKSGADLKDYNNGRGYRYITLRHNNIPKNTYVHILVAKAFIPNPENKTQVNHINGNKADNRVENLEWVTNGENMHHASKTNLLPVGERSYAAKVSNNDVLTIRKLSSQGVELSQLIMQYPLSKSSLSRIINGKAWKHI